MIWWEYRYILYSTFYTAVHTPLILKRDVEAFCQAAVHSTFPAFYMASDASYIYTQREANLKTYMPYVNEDCIAVHHTS